MRLVFVIASLECGGAQRVAALLCSRWAEIGWRVTVLTFDPRGKPPFFPMHPGVAVEPLDLAARSRSAAGAVARNVRRIRTLRSAIRRHAPDAVLSFLDTTNVTVLLATRGLRVPVVVSERIDPRLWEVGRAWSALRRLTYPWADSVVVQTRGAAGFFPWLRRSPEVIPNPVPDPGGPFPTERPPAPVSGRLDVVAAGRLTPQKGFDVLLRAFAVVAARRPEARLSIAGHGPEAGPLRRLADSLGLAGRVELLGTVPEIDPFLRSASLFALSSRYEGFPNVLLEAMARGIPVVATDCPSGPAEIVTNEVDGLLVSPDDPDALAAAMERLLGDPALRAKLGAAAMRVRERYSVAATADRWQALLRRSAARGRPVTVTSEAPS